MKKKKRRKSRLKRFLVLMFLFLIIIGIIYTMNLISTYTESKERLIYVNNNSISFDCVEGYKYMHLKLSNNDADRVKYNIISPSGKVMKSDELAGSSDFFADNEKGIWKVAFEVNKEINVNYSLWEGNLKFRDTMK